MAFMASLERASAETSRLSSDVQMTDEAASRAVKEILARDLHDTVAGTLATLLVELEMFKVDQQGREGVLRGIDVFEGFARTALRNLRGVLNELHEEPDLARGIVPAIREILVPNFERSFQIPIAVSVVGSIDSNLPGNVGLHVYRIAQEALLNVGRHSAARSAFIALRQGRKRLELDVVDDGRGFSRDRPAGYGTQSMRERALIVGGRLRIQSRPGSGTTVRLQVPLPSASES